MSEYIKDSACLLIILSYELYAHQGRALLCALSKKLRARHLLTLDGAGSAVGFHFEHTPCIVRPEKLTSD